MKSNHLLDFATGGALALWLTGPPMFVLGVAGGYPALAVLGPIAFVVGAWILVKEQRP